MKMVNKDKIDIYIKYAGDSDGFARCASQSEKEILPSDTWAFIDSVTEDVVLLENRVASMQMELSIKEKITTNIPEAYLQILVDFTINKK